MKEELLIRIREELEKEKRKLTEYSNRNKRIKDLMKKEDVKEFLDLTGLTYQVGNTKKMVTDDIIASMYYMYLHQIKDEDTNEIYVYMGTYKYSDEIDIVHGSRDIRVQYDSIDADYRVYRNIEKSSSEQVLINRCEEFERTHTIINSRVVCYDKTFYEIQRDFFIRAVKVDQESAKKMILRKYSR